MKKKIFILSVAVLFATAGFTLARQPQKEGCPKRDWVADHTMLSSLNLTPEQTEKVRSLTESFHRDMAPLRDQKFQCKTELKLLWMQMESDVEKIRAKQKELHDLKWQAMEKITDYRLSFRKMLTPEQLSKYLAQGPDCLFDRNGKNWHHGYHD